MAFVWLFSKQVPLALLPFFIYSSFHVLTYVRTYIIPTVSPTPATNGSGPKSQNKLAAQIGSLVKTHYDSSMFILALFEVFLWFRLLGSAILFQKGSWILLTCYTVFVRARIAQSPFIQNAIKHLTTQVDSVVARQDVHPAVKNGWTSTKQFAQTAHDSTDISRYINTSQAPPKKAQ
jgi:hypothetical protein